MFEMIVGFIVGLGLLGVGFFVGWVLGFIKGRRHGQEEVQGAVRKWADDWSKQHLGEGHQETIPRRPN